MQSVNVNLGGVTRVPDDVTNKNGELSVALNLASDGDGLKMLEKPVAVFNLRNVEGDEVVLCVHQNDGYKHYITTYDGKLWWRDNVSPYTPVEIGATDATQATVMGNTIITQGTTMEYWLWSEELNSNAGGYKALGQRPPMVNIQFNLESEMTVYPGLTNSGTTATWTDPIEIWDWYYSDDVPLPFANAVSDTHAYRSRMTEDSIVLPKSANVDTIFYRDHPELFDFSLKNATGKSNESDSEISRCVENLTDASLAWVNKFIANKANAENKFIFPFFIRYCYELYDGSQIMLSDPVLMIPSTHAPQFVIGDLDLKLQGFDYNLTGDGMPPVITGYDQDTYAKVAMWIKGRIFGVLSTLYYHLKKPAGNYSEWSDLIKCIGFYVTPPIYTYDQAGKVYGWKEVTDDWAGHWSEGYFNSTHKGRVSFKTLFDMIVQPTPGSAVPPTDGAGYGDRNHFVLKIPEHSNEDIRKAALNAGQYYKIAEIDFADFINGTYNTSTLYYEPLDINKHALETLTNQHQLVEEYTGGDMLSANVQYVYNRREHIADVTRAFHRPFSPWLQVNGRMIGANETYETAYSETVVVNEDGKHILDSGQLGLPLSTYQPLPAFLFYSNAQARKLYLDWVDSKTYRYSLTEHPVLNGAYWMSGLLWTNDTSYLDGEGVEISTDIPAETGGTLRKSGEVWTSNVENPFVFQAGNVNQVGDGVIKALRAAVAPLAEDQHGYAPMYVFTSQGVWAMTFSKDGTPAAIDHVCGDIITEGTEPLSLSQSCLVMTDRGLLALTGRAVKDLSERIDGTFADITMEGGVLALVGMNLLPYIGSLQAPLRGQACKMSYDYKHQRVYVWITSDGVSKGCGWVLNLRTGIWTQTQGMCAQVFNAYPSCEFVEDWHDTGLTVDTTNRVMTLDGDTKYDTALLTTRPIKLGETLDKLREVAVRGYFDPDKHGNTADVWTIVHGSRNWKDYGLISSAKGDRVTRLGGSAYRSHVVSVLLRNNGCTIDRLVLTYDAEQNNRLR